MPHDDKIYQHHWHWEEAEGQIIVFRDHQPIFYSALNVAAGGPLSTIGQILKGSQMHFGSWNPEEVDALRELFQFVADRNMDLADIAKFVVQALNHAETLHAQEPVLHFATHR